MNKKFDLIKIFCIVIEIILIYNCVSIPCGEPGVPNNGYTKLLSNRSLQSKGQYIPGTIVQYYCNSDSILYGHQRRQCFHKGFWDNKCPHCLTSTDINEYLNYSMFDKQLISQKDIFRSIDGDINTCFKSHSSNEQTVHSLVLILNEEIDIKAIRLKFSTNVSQNVNSSDYSLWIGSQTQQKDYEIAKSRNYLNNSENIISFTHNCIGIIAGNSLQINYIKNMNEFVLCEIQVFRIDNKSGLRCGSPDIPFNGYVRTQFKDNHLFANFYCNQNYTLIGNKEIKCESTGLWSQLTPICVKQNQNLKTKFKKTNPKVIKIEIKCNLLEDRNGKFIFTNGYEIGSQAILKCNKGFRLSSKYQLSQCLSTGNWSHFNNYSLNCNQIECHSTYFINNLTNISIKYKQKYIYSDEIEILCNNSLKVKRFCGINGFWVQKEDIEDKKLLNDSKNSCESDSNTKYTKTFNISINSLIIISSLVAIISTLITFLLFSLIRYLKRSFKRINRKERNRRTLSSVPANDISIIQIKHNFANNRTDFETLNNTSFYGSGSQTEMQTRISSSLLMGSSRKTSIIHTYSEPIEPIDFQFNKQFIEENIYSEPYSIEDNEIYSCESKTFD